jgi:hypothetical protein
MNKDLSMNSRRAFSPNGLTQSVQPNLNLHGLPGNSQFHFSDDLIPYIYFFLKDEPCLLPKLSRDRWLKLFSILISHRILPLAYWRINSLPCEFCLPQQINYRLRMAFLRSFVRCFRTEKQLQEIIEAFKVKGIRALVLRGPGLAWSVYPNPALRPFDDLDLMVLPEQMIQARAVLEKLGYKCLNKTFNLSRDFYREENFIHRKNPADNLLVDLHWENWELHPFFRRNEHGIEELFQRAIRVEFSNLTFETLHPVDALIQAAIHLAIIHNQDMRLIWIYDIALLSKQLQEPDDWEALKEKSVAWLGRLAVENSLKMAQLWAGLNLPDRFKNFSSWPKPQAEEIITWRHSTRDYWVKVLLKQSLSSLPALLRLARSLLHLLFPPADIIRYSYPPSRRWLLPVSYVRRWQRWFMQLILNRDSLSKKQG